MASDATSGSELPWTVRQPGVGQEKTKALCTSLSLSHQVVSDSLWPQALAVRQAPLSMRFPKQEYWSGWPFPTPGDPPDPGTEPPFSCIGRQSLYR